MSCICGTDFVQELEGIKVPSTRATLSESDSLERETAVTEMDVIFQILHEVLFLDMLRSVRGHASVGKFE